MKQVTVVGGGLVGLTTAFHVAEAGGAKVRVLDRAAQLGTACSWANAAIMCAGSSTPRPLPDSWLRASHWRKSGSVFIDWRRVWRDPAFAEFASAAMRRYPRTDEAVREASRKMELLATTGVKQLKRVCEELPELQGYHVVERGQLVVFQSQSALEKTLKRLQFNLSPDYAMSLKVLDRDQCMELEPCLKYYEESGSESSDHKIIGGIFKTREGVAEPQRFVRGLTAACERLGIDIVCEADVKNIVRDGSQWSIEFSDGAGSPHRVTSDAVVIAAGVHSSHLIGQLGGCCPVYGARGYSITVDIPDDEKERFLPTRSVTQGDLLLYTSPLEASELHGKSRFRLTGFADFDGLAIGRVNSKRLSLLLDQIDFVFPGLICSFDKEKCLEAHRVREIEFDSQGALKSRYGWLDETIDPLRAWTGLRPLSSSHLPFVGEVNSLDGILLNCGHGMMGWTASNSSAAILTRDIYNYLELPLPEHSLAGSFNLESQSELQALRDAISPRRI